MQEDESTTIAEKPVEADRSTPKTVVDRIQSQFNEEKWTRISAKDVTISRFKLLESLLEEASQEKITDQLTSVAKEHLKEYEASLSARYFLGMLALKTSSPDDLHHLKDLLSQFQTLSKWAVVDYLCDKMLEQNENRAVLKAKAEALEKLGKTKEAVPILEKLAQVDRRNPDIAFKYAEAIISEDIDKGVQFYKQATEIYAKNLMFDKLKIAWGRLVELIPEDFPFYRKVERTLKGHRQKEVLAELYVQLAHYYIKKENFDSIIFLCKKILECNSQYSRFKNELIRAYRTKYKEHSLLEDFIRYSGLLDNRKNVANSIQNFETNIVFDKDNYVHHRSWGVGKIKELDTKQMVIDFKNKLDHKMNIEMALKSLKPLREDHFLVHQHEKPKELQVLFETDIIDFFRLFLSSFNNRLSLSEIKSYLSNTYVPEKGWSKWWPKTRIAILKDNLIGVSPQRRDIIELRDNPITISEAYIEKFQAAQNFEDKVAIAGDTLKEGSEGLEALEFIQPTFKEGLKSLELEHRLQSLWLLELIDEHLGDDERVVGQELIESCKETLRSIPKEKIVKLGLSLKSIDILKKYIKSLREAHPEWEAIYLELLYYLPVKFHKHLISDLIAEKNEDVLKNFFVRLGKEAGSHPELFLLIFRGLVSGHWETSYLSPEGYILSFFRLGRMLPKIETKGTKQKNMFKEMIGGNYRDDFLSFIEQHTKSGSPRKYVSLLREINFITDIEKSKFIQSLMEKWPDEFNEDQDTKSTKSIESIVSESEKKGSGVASQNAILRMKKELEHILNIDIPANSREIGIAQEKGDLRENAEYKAAMEKQSILQSTVTRLENELKEIVPILGASIPQDRITIGAKVKLNEEKNHDTFVYSVMDRWDADIDSGIISYQSPLGKALLGHKVGDKIQFGSGDEEKHLEIMDINRAVDDEGLLI